MRAGLFLARVTYFTPQLAALATVLARATQRPDVSEDLESDEPRPQRGDLLPIAPVSKSDEAGLRALSRHWSPEAFDQYAKGFGSEIRPDICIALTPPLSDFTRNLMSRARRVVGFRSLRGVDGFVPDEGLLYLDAEWSPRRAADPESGRSADEGRTLPPYGLMLQRFGLLSSS